MLTADNSRMTGACQIVPETMDMVTRRVTQRRFLLKLSPESVQLQLYCIHGAVKLFFDRLRCQDTIHHWQLLSTFLNGKGPFGSKLIRAGRAGGVQSRARP